MAVVLAQTTIVHFFVLSFQRHNSRDGEDGNSNFTRKSSLISDDPATLDQHVSGAKDTEENNEPVTNLDAE